MENSVEDLASRALNFKARADDIFSIHESSRSRVMNVDRSRKQLKGLSIKQEELLDEALKCVGCGAFRAVHVMAWAAFSDFLLERLTSGGMVKLKSTLDASQNRRKFQPIIDCSSVEEIRENVKDWLVIDAAVELGLISAKESPILHGERSKRNQCSHPTDYKVNQNTALGYVNGLMHWIEVIKSRSI